YNNYIVSQWCIERRVPYIITAHGNFNPEALKISVWKKRLARAWFADRMLRNASCFQALTEYEYNAIRRFGLKQPVCLIPNGIKLPPDCDVKPAPFEEPDLFDRGMGRY